MSNSGFPTTHTAFLSPRSSPTEKVAKSYDDPQAYADGDEDEVPDIIDEFASSVDALLEKRLVQDTPSIPAVATTLVDVSRCIVRTCLLSSTSSGTPNLKERRSQTT